MAYAPTPILLPSGLDEIGLLKSMVRLPNESLASFKHRLILEHRQPTDNSFQTIKKSPGRQLGLPEIPIARITFSDSALRPRIKVTSSKCYVWLDQDSTPSLAVDIQSRGSTYFVGQLLDELASLDDLSIEVLDAAAEYKYSRQLMICDSLKASSVNLLENFVNRLPNKYINDILFSDVVTFQTEVASQDLVQESGEYFVNKDSGVVFSHELAHGYVSYSYNEFPFILKWQPVRVFELNDEDIDSLIKEPVLNDTSELLLLNSTGARYYNELLNQYPLEWGE